MGQRNDAGVRRALGIAPGFIVKEEEHLVLTTGVGWTTFTKARQVDWSTDAAAKLVTRKLCSLNSVLVIEKAVGCGGCGAVVFAESTMNLIRAALGNDFDLSATAAT